MNGFNRTLGAAACDGDGASVAGVVADATWLSRSDPDTALMHASHRGHQCVLLLLLPHALPLARNSEALWHAARYRRRRCIHLFLPHSRPEAWERWQWDDLPDTSRTYLQATLHALGRPCSVPPHTTVRMSQAASRSAVSATLVRRARLTATHRKSVGRDRPT